MAEVSESLWANNILSKKIDTPFAILKQQAKYLSELTKGVLVGEITNFKTDFITGFSLKPKPFMVLHLSIDAPFLNNYKTIIMEIKQEPAVIYPLEITNLLEERIKPIKIDNEHEFKQVIGNILSSEKVSNLIANLYAQSEVLAA